MLVCNTACRQCLENNTYNNNYYNVSSVQSNILIQNQTNFQILEPWNIFLIADIWATFSFVFTMIDILIHKLFDQVYQKHVINLEKYPDPQIRKSKCFTLVKWSYSQFYYFISSICAYILMYNTDALPIWMGGNGQSLNMVKKYPGINAPQYLIYWMKVFYICQFGKHFSRTFTHIFIKPQGKFYEMALHHALSVYLIIFSYLTNFWLFGIIVLFIHDISDFFLIAARIYREVRKRNQYILNTLYVFAMSSWIYFRIFGLAGCCIYPAFYILFRFQFRTDFGIIFPLQVLEYYQYILFLPGLFMAVMMSILLVLQLFWTYYIGQSFIATTISQKITQHKYD